jgi:hypothetical protein
MQETMIEASDAQIQSFLICHDIVSNVEIYLPALNQTSSYSSRSSALARKRVALIDALHRELSVISRFLFFSSLFVVFSCQHNFDTSFPCGISHAVSSTDEHHVVGSDDLVSR